MSISYNAIQEEALRLLGELETMPFEDCYPLSRDFDNLPDCPALYAIKYKAIGIVYIGKSGNIKSRFRGGHKVLSWALLDRIDPSDIRIAIVPVSFEWSRLLLQLERVAIQRRKPPFNTRVAKED